VFCGYFFIVEIKLFKNQQLEIDFMMNKARGKASLLEAFQEAFIFEHILLLTSLNGLLMIY